MTEAPGTLWRNREFNLLWTSQSLSDLGTAVSGLAVPLFVLALTGSPVRAGLVGTLGLVVTVLARLPAGVLADRLDRRRIMLVCDALRMVLYLTLGLMALAGWASMTAVVAVVVVGAVANAFFGTAEHSSLRAIVAVGQLPAAVARNEARSYGTSLAGPPLGGLLFGIGAALPFFGNAATFLASLAGVSLVRRPLQEAREPNSGGHLAALAEGLRFVLDNAFLLTILVVVAPLNLALHGIIFTVIVTLQADGVAPALIGTVQTLVAIGGLLGSLFAPAVLRRLELPLLVRSVCWASVLLMSLSALMIGTVAAAVPIGLTMLLGPATNAALFAHQAAITPDRLQGRVVSVIIVLATSASAAAPLLAGVLMTALNSTAAVLTFTAMVAASAVAASTTPALRV